MAENERQDAESVRGNYATVEDTVWPVALESVEWSLRYGDDYGGHRMLLASVVSAYRALTDERISQADAIAKLKRARRGQKLAVRQFDGTTPADQLRAGGYDHLANATEKSAHIDGEA